MIDLISELTKLLLEEEKGFWRYFVDAEEYKIPGDRDPETGHKYIHLPIPKQPMDTEDAADEFLDYEEVRQEYHLYILSDSGREHLYKNLCDDLEGHEWYRWKDLENSQDDQYPEDYQNSSDDENPQDDQDLPKNKESQNDFFDIGGNIGFVQPDIDDLGV